MSRKIWLSLALLAAMPVRADTVVVASWYGGPRHEGRPTASGCPFHARGLTAASRSLPLGTILRVRRAGHATIVLVNDRGPYIQGRGLDLSRGAAEALGMREAGVAAVEIEPLGVRPVHCHG
jgi:rare lipoprotein A